MKTALRVGILLGVLTSGAAFADRPIWGPSPGYPGHSAHPAPAPTWAPEPGYPRYPGNPGYPAPGGWEHPRPPSARPAPPRWNPNPGEGSPHPSRGVGYGRLGTPPPADDSDDEIDAANMMANAIGNLGCDRAGEALRNLSNALLSNARFASQPSTPGNPGDWRGRDREDMRRRWAAHLQNPVFWRKVWDRLADAYRGCNLTCFDDGVAIGQISGMAYCSASVAAGGLSGPGFQVQAPLPLCQNTTFVGCQSGYRRAAASVDGCSTYDSGNYTDVFDQFISQDCHIDP